MPQHSADGVGVEKIGTVNNVPAETLGVFGKRKAQVEFIYTSGYSERLLIGGVQRRVQFQAAEFAASLRHILKNNVYLEEWRMIYASIRRDLFNHSLIRN